MEYRTYQYPKFQKAVNFVFLSIVLFMAILTWILQAIGLLGSNNRIVSDAPAMPVSILVGLLLILGGVYVNMLTPDIRVQNDSFQLKTVFYQSQWIEWENIRFVKEHLLSRRRYAIRGIGVDNIHPIYSLIGFTQQMGEPSFLLTERIQGYNELMQLLETNRPDLFYDGE